MRYSIFGLGCEVVYINMKNFVYLTTSGLTTGVRLFDIATKIWYLCAEEFKSIELFIVFIVTLIVPFFVNFLVFVVVKQNYFPVAKKDAVLFCISETFGLNFAVFAVFDVFCWKDKQKFKIFYDLFYIGPFIISALQSVPLIIVQVFNTEDLDDWSRFRIIAVCATAGSFVIPLLKVFVFRFKSDAKVCDRNKSHLPNLTESQNKNDSNVKAGDIKVFNIE